MTRLTFQDLRRRTLARQFPTIAGRGPDSVLELMARLGPIQSQVPRAPFLTIASRLPGVSYATISALFESHQLLKTSNLRGTVHTSVRGQFGWLDAVARPARAALLRRYLKLRRVTPEAVVGEIEAYAAEVWRPRSEIVTHLRDWLAEHESAESADAVQPTTPEALLWGHSGLIRRPRDGRWERRTDTLHRLAYHAVPGLSRDADYPSALAELVRVHLGAYGPATRQDLGYFLGAGLGRVDAAVSRLGSAVVKLSGPDRDDYLDLADSPNDGEPDLGVRLLPEFEGLLVGFSGPSRTRFLEAFQLPKVWLKINGLFSPVVLSQDRVVASWKTISRGSRTELEVTMLDPHRRLSEGALTDSVRATERALDLSVTELRIRGP